MKLLLALYPSSFAPASSRAFAFLWECPSFFILEMQPQFLNVSSAVFVHQRRRKSASELRKKKEDAQKKDL